MGLRFVFFVFLLVVFVMDVSSFPAFKQDDMYGSSFPEGQNGEELIPEHLQTTFGEKRTAINNKHEWGDKEFPGPERWPWTNRGEKRTAINNKHEWGDKEFPGPERWPWTNRGEK